MSSENGPDGDLGMAVSSATSGNAQLILDKGKKALARGDVAKARRHFSRAIEYFPSQGEAYFRLAGLELVEQKPQAAADLLTTALHVAPERPSALYLLALALVTLFRPFEAIPHLQRALEIDPADQLSRLLLAKSRLQAGQEELGRTCLAKLDMGQVQNPVDQIIMSEVLFDYGNLKQARRILADLVDRDPSRTDAILPLTKILAPEDGPRYESVVRGRLQQSELGPNERYRLLFAAGNIADAAGRYGQAYANYSEANALYIVAHGLDNPPFDLPRYNEVIERMKALFDATFISRTRLHGLPGGKPVFIVGLPRSGKSLLESLVARHPSVAAAGEVNLPNFISADLLVDEEGGLTAGFENRIRAIGAQDARTLARDYMDYLDRFGTDYVVNTMPPNYNNIGLIKLLWPDARIIDVRRDALDNCLQCFLTPFKNQFYSRDLATMGGYLRCYTDLMAHWHGAYRQSVMTVTYEDLIDNPGLSTQEVLQFIGVPTGSSENSADVMRSYEGRPIDRSGIGCAKNYTEHLGELADILSQATPSAVAAQTAQIQTRGEPGRP